MGQKLYLECYSGISGDMTVAALLDLGADAAVLDKALRSLPVSGFETRTSRVSKSGIDACDFNVILEHDNHDHDMEYLHGEGGSKDHEHEHEHHHHHHGLGHLIDHLFHREHDHDHDHEHEHEHSHEHAHSHHHDHGHDHGHTHSHDHSHSHSHGGHDHVHRGLSEITDIISKGDLTDRARATALKIFDIIAEAEAKAHGLPKDKVHFHEVGAVDSIVDIVAVAVCLDNLGIDEVIVPVLYEGTGTVRCQHGILPVPVPAVANIVSAQKLNLHITGTQGEFVTPTGAAIVAAIRTSESLPENFRIVRTGIGAGKRNYERPSILRAMLIEECRLQKASSDEIVKLESNIDDCTGESLGFAMEHLLEAGARDVHYFPVFMKKNRPGYQINVICREDQIAALSDIIFEDTTTIGVRIQKMGRRVLEREIRKVSTSFGESRVKVCTLPSGKRRFYPEHDDVARISRETGMSYQEAFRAVLSECAGE